MSIRSAVQILVPMFLAVLPGCYDWDRCSDGTYPEDHEGDDCDRPEREYQFVPPEGDFRGTVSNADAFNGKIAFVSVWEIHGQDAFPVNCQQLVVSSGSVSVTWPNVMEPDASWDAIWVLNLDTNGVFAAAGDDEIFYSDLRNPATNGVNDYSIDLAADSPLPSEYQAGWDGWQCW